MTLPRNKKAPRGRRFFVVAVIVFADGPPTRWALNPLSDPGERHAIPSLLDTQRHRPGRRRLSSRCQTTSSRPCDNTQRHARDHCVHKQRLDRTMSMPRYAALRTLRHAKKCVVRVRRVWRSVRITLRVPTPTPCRFYRCNCVRHSAHRSPVSPYCAGRLPHTP